MTNPSGNCKMEGAGRGRVGTAERTRNGARSQPGDLVADEPVAGVRGVWCGDVPRGRIKISSGTLSRAISRRARQVSPSLPAPMCPEPGPSHPAEPVHGGSIAYSVRDALSSAQSWASPRMPGSAPSRVASLFVTVFRARRYGVPVCVAGGPFASGSAGSPHRLWEASRRASTSAACIKSSK